MGVTNETSYGGCGQYRARWTARRRRSVECLAACGRIDAPGASGPGGRGKIELIAGGQTLLTGSFTTSSTGKDQTERTASLTSSAGVKGRAEIEIQRTSGGMKEELELSAQGLPPQAAYEVRLDGHAAGTFTTTNRGGANLKWARVK
jgi:hypothetical protein